ncbi:MAG TPA: hypothetical protein VGV57_10455, partial [Thermoleophilaceae bacterium]|nr:hypothetical protein [Thermoleophilaceae bacterium]
STSSSSARNLSDGATLAMRAYLLKLRLVGQSGGYARLNFPRSVGRHQSRGGEHDRHARGVIGRPPLAETRVAVDVDDLVEVEVASDAELDPPVPTPASQD